jgi:hypothetical protein
LYLGLKQPLKDENLRFYFYIAPQKTLKQT